MMDVMLSSPLAGMGAGGLLVLLLMRYGRLLLSRDKVTLKGDASDLSAFGRLEERVKQMERRIGRLERDKGALYMLVLKFMAYFAQCRCEGIDPPSREELQRDFEKVVDEINSGDEGECKI